MTIQIRRGQNYRLASLVMQADGIEVELKLLSEFRSREAKTILRSFFTYVKPWLKQLRDPAPTSKVHYGWAIRRQRLTLGLSQAQAALIVGIRRTHLSDIERGQHYPQAATRKKIHDTLFSKDLSF